ncbi:hypothetical protein SAMN05192583_3081 [Sphingomonas gellani]|uniref:Uncharacterized protein n=1 Tax=Sphingomonas gellani TaxID=1166340 RepID=A0A1H8HK15_9SPHN|nr:hypothetical protein [Sphingomonas gellani]SEN56572.1 hypothetical protein SAMN05192583_3081 [Sphingomonas gellani]
MEPMFFVMAILGCGDGNLGCQEARVLPARYETMAQCRADLPTMLARNSDVDAPSLAANCRVNGLTIAQKDAPRPRG